MLSLSASPVEEKLLSSWSKRELEQDVDSVFIPQTRDS